MTKLRRRVLVIPLVAASFPAAAVNNDTYVPVGKMPRIATVDERFQSYNVEMVEVTGGVFWKPYERMAPVPASASKEDFYAAAKGPLPPIDLSNVRLRRLAAALGPAYVRVSGSDANAVYFHDANGPAPAKPPEGFQTVLTRPQWRGVIDFARAVNGKIVTSFAVSNGVRDAEGRWNPDQARRLIAFTHSLGGEIAAAEFVNEPNLAPAGAVYTPPGYDEQAFARDFAAFRPLVKKLAPRMLILGPSSTSEGVKLVPDDIIDTRDLLSATPRPQFDVFSYHAYGASSNRCTGRERVNTTADEALTGEWLAQPEVIYDFYAPVRDRFQPGTPMWVTETAQSSCGGDRWAKTFLDTFRYLDQLARHARRGVQAVMHNTFAVSEYGLVDRETMTPRPNYWAALLWRRLMGTTVLDARVPLSEGLHLYAHCLPGRPGGVTLLAINNSRTKAKRLEVPAATQRYTLSARQLEDEQVSLNGRPLALAANGALPDLPSTTAPAGTVELAPATITFMTVAGAQNPACSGTRQ